MICFWVHNNLYIVKVSVFLECVREAFFLSVKGQIPTTDQRKRKSSVLKVDGMLYETGEAKV